MFQTMTFGELRDEKKNGRLDDERKKGHNEMDIYSSPCFGGCLFVVGMRMNSGENGTRGEKIEEREVWGRKRDKWRERGSEVRPINKQRIDFLPLSAIPGKPPRLAPSGCTHPHLC